MSLSKPDDELVGGFTTTLRRFAADAIDPAAIDRESRVPPAVLSALAELGVFGLSIPVEYGGSDLGLPGVCEVVAALAERDRSVAVTCGLHLGLGTRGLVAFGSGALKERYLPDLALGSRLAAFATTEAGAGSDLTAIRTVASEDAGALRLNGEKVYVTNGGLAQVFTLTASTPGLGGARRGHSLLVVDRQDAGVEVGREEKKLGIRGSSTTSLLFEDVRIPAGRVIGEPGRGMTHLQHVLAWGRTTMAAGCVGAAREALKRVLEHVTTRVQFGRPIGELDVVKEQVADLAALQFATEALVAETAAAEDDDARLLRQSQSAKIFASEADGEIADGAVQLFGGAGFIEETGLPLLLRDARITRIFEGANDVLATHVGAAEVMRPSARASTGARSADELAESVSLHRLEAKARHGARLLRCPTELHRIGRLVVLREATDAAVRRAEAEGTAHARALCEQWQQSALRRAQAWQVDGPPRERTEAITAELYEGARA